jgi:ferritin-like metal-binding protein YciE
MNSICLTFYRCSSLNANWARRLRSFNRKGCHPLSGRINSIESLLEPTMPLNDLSDLFHDELRDILSAERQLIEAMPKMAKMASSVELRNAFELHLEQTRVQATRVEQAFGDTGKPARAKTCEAMKGLLKEASALMDEKAAPEVMDAALIASAQKVEHYEIATYGTLCTWAKLLGYSEALELLKLNLNEEEETDEALSVLAETVNSEAQA